MPLATNPKERFTVVLESDKDRPDGERPEFEYWFLTGIEQKENTHLIDALDKAGSGEKALDDVYIAAAIGMAGWRNIRDRKGKEIAFDPSKLPEIMGMEEVMELAIKVFGHQRFSAEDKKKFDSQSQSSTDKSAKAAGDPKNAKTSPTPSNQSE